MIKNKCGYIAIVGRPNVGKSTLMNRMLGEKISIISRKPQTTRHQILGIKTLENAQLIFVDTPGIHIDERKMINRYMNRAARSSLFDANIILFVIEGTRWTEEDEKVVAQLEKAETQILLVINKIDKVTDKTELLPVIDKLQKRLWITDIIPISAQSGDNIDILEKHLIKYLPEGPFLFDPSQKTDKNLHFQLAELIREKLIRYVVRELPYTTMVEIERREEHAHIEHIYAIIWVEREGQKAIIIGKQGEKLKSIGLSARKDMEALLKKKVNLKLWVKVKEGWSDSEAMLHELGIQ